MPVESSDGVIRIAGPDDLRALDDLFESAFGARRSSQWWAWKYRQHPIDALSVVFEVEGEVVAHCGGTMVNFRYGSNVVRAMQIVDVMASRSRPSGMGGGGFFARTTVALFREAYSRGVRLMYGFPGERHRRAGERLFGYPRTGPVGELVLDPSADDVSVAALTESSLGEFQLDARSAAGALREPEWLRWRYLEHPEHRYERVAVRGLISGTRASAIVYDAGETFRLMELGGRSDERSLRALTQRLGGLGRPVVFWCSPEHEISTRLERCGFRATRRNHSVASGWFRDPAEWSGRSMLEPGALDATVMYYTLGDYDVD